MKPDEQIEDPQTEIGQLSDHLKEYIGIRRELFELKLWDKLFGSASAAITWGIISLLGILCIFMFSAAAAYLIGSALGKTWLGFLIVAGTYGLLAIILILGRDAILQKPLTDRFIDKFVNDDEEDKEEKNEQQDSQQKAA
jgi:hypothetical protein